ncbi:hypothetical protein [Rhizobium ruizarguesonis]|uniref:hypothetical protein n=1 Tax=Rhizobium ruizarguesonis TaxID=2081791 RepID=UPI0013E04F40|nr:hypothetical protein [Rhizobium ruizarguesonis]MBY5891364.1 hypothetical protein [Rhizobium leguminosarum]NEI81571.1 hypothetical protein [Rhizobium ruizarguesonis]QSZ05601.1 hypothetical protein J3P73_37300 [Rhizobium ruizarguesonis]
MRHKKGGIGNSVAGRPKVLSDKIPYEFVARKCPKTSSKKIVGAALLALTDPDVTDRHVLDTIYALAIDHRMDEIGDGDPGDEQDNKSEIAPSVKPSKRRLDSSTSPSIAP